MATNNELTELIAIRQAIEAGNGGGGSGTPATPGFIRVTTNGSIPQGARNIQIMILSGSGTIQGTPVDTTFEVIEFPYDPDGWDEITYTVDADSEFAIITGS